MNDPKKNPAAWLADMKRLGRCVRPGIYATDDMVAFDSQELCLAMGIPLTEANMKATAEAALEWVKREDPNAKVVNRSFVPIGNTN